MAPTSDLGPIDPQIQVANGILVSAKDMIAAVDEATERVQSAPETYPLHAALLADVTALMVQQARAALARTDDMLEEALRANTDRTEEEVAALRASLAEPLITAAKSHGAIFGMQEARDAGLPVTFADPSSLQWQTVWRLWAKYFTISQRCYEGAKASRMFPWPEQQQ
jgi:hypothetical protein